MSGRYTSASSPLRATTDKEGRHSDALTSAERAELEQLRREVATLRHDREILLQAAACFAEETGQIG